jgi:hypothetical protein
MLPNADAATTLSAIEAAARAAQELLDAGHRCTLIVGCELSVFMRGILPGVTHGDRLRLLTDPMRFATEVAAARGDPQATGRTSTWSVSTRIATMRTARPMPRRCNVTAPPAAA